MVVLEYTTCLCDGVERQVGAHAVAEGGDDRGVDLVHAYEGDDAELGGDAVPAPSSPTCLAM